MPVVPACVLEPLREEFLALPPEHRDDHSLGCHNPRIPDALVFDRLILVLVSGMDYERVADHACSATTIRRRRDHWITLGMGRENELVAEQLRQAPPLHERRRVCFVFSIALATAVITIRSLIRRAWFTYRWGTRPCSPRIR